MKKHIAILTAFIMLLLVSACGNSEDTVRNAESETVNETVATSENTEQNTEEMTVSEDTTIDKGTHYTENNVKETVKENNEAVIYDGPTDGTAPELVESDYFTLEVPTDWKGKYTYEKVVRDNGSFYLSMYELKEHNSSGAGCLFTIALFPEGTDYSYLPYYVKYGQISDDSSNYNIVIMYPTDVQFTTETSDDYNDMYESIDDVLDTMKGVKGFTITK